MYIDRFHSDFQFMISNEDNVFLDNFKKYSLDEDIIVHIDKLLFVYRKYKKYYTLKSYMLDDSGNMILYIMKYLNYSRKLHRDKLPALYLFHKNEPFCMVHYKNGMIHNENGYAYIHPDISLYYLNDKIINPDKFMKFNNTSILTKIFNKL